MNIEAHRAMIIARASCGFLNLTKTGDHKMLRASWTQNIIGTDLDCAAARPMRRYKMVHTGPNTQSGGLNPGTCGAS